MWTLSEQYVQYPVGLVFCQPNFGGGGLRVITTFLQAVIYMNPVLTLQSQAWVRGLWEQ